MAKPKVAPRTPEEELDAQVEELFAAIAEARKAAGLAYEFSQGAGTSSAYAHGAVQACTRVAKLAKRILGDGQT
jgi:hypothetical protein